MPRLRADELTGMISLLTDKFVRKIETLLFVSMRRNSVFDGLRSSLFNFTQERISVKVVVSVLRDETEFVGVKEMYLQLGVQGRHFNFFFGAKFFIYFSMPPDY